ncbi:MAG TPA: hypothetical protein VF719_10310 [Abditibacteriaceae bacterium]|jgi:single-stranded-DNA-specific exonuclease
MIPNPTPDEATARAAFVRFIEKCDRNQRIVALHDVDADGISAGAVWQRVMKDLGFTNLARVQPNRERNAWTQSNRERVEVTKPQRLFVLDLGSQPHRVVENVPACFIDHHRPEGIAEGDTLISAYSWDPIPTTSLLMWQLGAALTDVGAYDWLAAIGLVGDLGERAPFAMLEAAKKKYTAKYLKEAAALLNAARRSSAFDPEIAASALLNHDGPRALVNSDSPEVQRLNEARAEVKAALDEARKAAPVFAGNVALIRVNSTCQVHPLIAQQWRGRLPKYIVIAANEGYIPGRVNFSGRTSSGASVIDFLRGISVEGYENQYGHGHDAASGGSLPVEQWNELLEKMGFNSAVFAQP